MKKRLAILLACALVAASCEIRFELDNVSEPALCLQYIPHAGCGNGMAVSYAEPVFGTLSKEQYPFAASDVSVTINGKAVAVSEDKEASSWNGHMLMLAAEPSPGDEVEVLVKGRGIPDATARTTVPQPPVISSITMKADTSDIYTITIKLGDSVKDGEYYGLKAARRFTYVEVAGIGTPENPIEEKIDTVVSISYFMPGRIASIAELNSLDLDAYANIYYTDGFVSVSGYGGEMMALLQKRHFSGDSYTFYANSFDAFSAGDFDLGFDLDTTYVPDVEEPADPENQEDPDYPYYPEDPDIPYYWDVLESKEEYRFEVFRLSEEFYNYAKAQYLCNFNMLSNFGVTPPNFTYTNVSGGLGVVAGVCSASTDWLPAPKAAE